MKAPILTICLSICPFIGQAQSGRSAALVRGMKTADNGQSRSGIELADSPRIFAPGVVSTGDFEFNASFTPDEHSIFFSKATSNFGYIAIFSSRQEDGQWTSPQTVSFTGIYRDCDPFVSADGKRLYFASDRPVNGMPYKDFEYHFFYVALDGDKVASDPTLINLPLRADQKVSYLSLADNGNIYFTMSDSTKTTDIYMCSFKDGQYDKPVRLSFNDPKYNDFDPMISRDERFIIFCCVNRQGLGSGDLYISFKTDKGWTDPQNLGPKVNTSGYDGTPGLSRDNKTLYFTSYKENSIRPEFKEPVSTQQVFDLLHSYRNGFPNIYSIGIGDLLQAHVR